MDRWIQVCEGQLNPDLHYCNGQWLVVSAQGVPGAFDVQQLDPALLGAYLGAGASLVALIYLAGVAAGELLKMIRRG